MLLYGKSNACQSRFLVTKYIEIIGLTFIAVVVAVHMAKVLTGIMDFAFSIFNKLAGGAFSVLKPFCF
jgi:hypothetical protein